MRVPREILLKIGSRTKDTEVAKVPARSRTCGLCALGELCARLPGPAEGYLKIETGLPTLTSSFKRAASQFAVRMQPWLAARPIVSGLFVP
jgi:hypothetical protein